MFKIYFKIAWRNITKRKFYSALNIFGLALGIACSLLLYLFISYHLSFDRYHKNASKTYRVLNELSFGKTLHEKGTSIAMYHALTSGITHVSDAAVMLNNYTFTITVNDSSKTERRFKEDKSVALVSPDWFKMFDYKWIAGNADQLSLPNTAVITQKQSIKYFGHSSPIGRVMVFENRQPVTIVGLLSDKPYNTDLKSDIYLSLSSLKNIRPGTDNAFFTDWGWMNSTTSLYITLNDKKSKAEVASVINNMVKPHFGDIAKYYHFWLQPLADIHFNTDYGGDIQKSLLVTLAIIGVLILIIASFNYINISIAQQSKRMVEIGTRKVLGGTIWQLFTQFIIETFIMVSIAIILGVVIVAFGLPTANQFFFSQEPVHIISFTNAGIFLGILLAVLVFLSGVYPAFVLSRINIFKPLKNKSGTWKAGRTRKIVVIGQNTVAYMLIISAFMMVLQVRFLKNTDIGFNRDAVVMVPVPDSSQLKKDLLKQQLSEIPEIESFTFCFTSPASENNRGGSVKFDNRPDYESWPARSAVGDTSFVKLFGIKIVAGRNIRQSEASHEYLINETMVKKLGLKNPAEVIGKPLEVGQFNDQNGTIVGVVKDFNTKSLEVPIEPVVMASVPDMFTTIGVKLSGTNLQTSIQRIRKDWEEVYPKEVFEYQFLEDKIARLYQKEVLQQKIISLAGSIAVVISCLGLLGLASLVTLQRTKEIGIRKVVGASAGNIAVMLSKDFLKLVLISFLIASPLAWWAIDKWLQNFAYRITVSWWIFVLTGGLAIIIALLTVSIQAIKAALANPVDSLRSE
jgi:putative ABC transport system permease protein